MAAKRRIGGVAGLTVPNKAYRFSRSWTSNLTPTSVDAGTTQFVTLGSFPNFAEIQAFFDRYRIEKVRITWQLLGLADIAGYDTIFPTIHTAYDPNDGTAPSTVGEVLEYQNSETFQFTPTNRVYSRTFVPRCNMGMESGSATAAPGTWAQTVSSGLPWRGLKTFIQNYNSTARNHVMAITVKAVYSADTPK